MQENKNILADIQNESNLDSKTDLTPHSDPIKDKNTNQVDITNSILQEGEGKNTSLIQSQNLDTKFSDYEGYIDPSKYDPLEGYNALNRARANNQSTWEQVYNFGKQAVAEIVGGTISGIGSIFELPSAIYDEMTGKDADFNNFLISWGEGIKDWTRENNQIYRENPNNTWDLSDPAWWLNHGVSVASTVSLMIPAAGTVRAAGMFAKTLKIADKVGDATKYWGKLGTSAMVMRNAENMTESLNVSSQTKQNALRMFDDEDTYNKVKEGEVGAEMRQQNRVITKESLSDFIAAKAGWRAYQINATNIVFDLVQLAPLFKGFKAGTRTNKFMEKPIAQALGKNFTKADRIKRFMNPILSPIARQSTEGIEEGINFIGGAEGEYYGKVLSGSKDPSTFGERLKKYLQDGHFYESAAWGVAGGIAFDAGTGLLNRIQGNKDNTVINKISEIEQRKQIIDSFSKKIKEVETNENIPPEDRKDLIGQLKSELSSDLAMRASAVGNIDILLDNVKSDEFKNQLIEAGIAKEDDVDKAVNYTIDDILRTEKLYNKYYNKFFVGNESSEVKNHLITESIKTNFLLNKNNDRVSKTLNKLTSEKTNDINYQEKLSSGISEAVELVALRKAKEIFKGSQYKGRVENIDKRIKEVEKKYKGLVEFNINKPDNFLKSINPDIIDLQTDLEIYKEATESHRDYLNKLESKEYKKELQSARNSQLKKEKEKLDKEEKQKEVKTKREKTKSNIKNAKQEVNTEKEIEKVKKEEGIDVVEATKNDIKESITELPNPNIDYKTEMKKYSNDSMFMSAISVNDINQLKPYVNLYRNGISGMQEPNEAKAQIIENKIAELEAKQQGTVLKVKKTDRDNAIDVRDNIENKNQEPEIYTESDQKELNKEIEIIDETLGETPQHITDIDKNNIIYDTKRVLNGFGNFAYLSRNYINIVNNINNNTIVSKEDIDNLLNDNLFDKTLLDINEFQEGTEITLEVDTDLKYTDKEGNKITYNSLLEEEKKTNSPNSLVPIVIKKDGKKVAYLHDMSWIKESNISGDIKSNKEKLQLIRDFIIQADKKVVTTIKSKDYGQLIKSKDNEQQDVIKAFPSKNLQFAIGKEGKFHINREEVTSEKVLNKDVKDGIIYSILPVGKENKNVVNIAAPLRKKKVNNVYSQSLRKAVELYLSEDKDAKFVKDLYEVYDINILTEKGLRDYIENFIYSYNPRNDESLFEYLDGKPSDVHLLTVTGNSIDFGSGRGIGNTSISKNTPENIKENLLEKLQTHIEKMYMRINIDNLNTGEITIPLLTETDTITELSYNSYNDFIKSHTTTNLLSFNLDNGNYAYTIQPVIEMETSFAIENKTNELSTTTEEGTKVKTIKTSLKTPDGKDFNLPDIEDVDFLPDVLNNEQVKEIKKSITDNLLIEGMTANKQFSIVDAIAADINNRVIDKKKVTEKEVFDTWEIFFTNIRKAYKEKGSEKSAKELDKILNNWKQFKDFTLLKLTRITNVKIKKGEDLTGLEDISSLYEKINFDDSSSLQIDSKNTASTRLKRFLSFIPNLNKDFSIKTNYIGLQEIVPFDEVYNDLSAVLGNSKADYKLMITKLESFVKAKPYYKSIIDKLNNASQQVKNEFVITMAKHYVPMKQLLWTKNKNGHVLIPYDSDSTSVSKVIVNNWNSNFKNTKFVTQDKDNNHILNEDILNLSNKLTSELNLIELNDVLSKLGINLEDSTLQDLLENGLRHNGKRLEYKYLFTSTNGVFNILSKEIKNTLKSNLEDSKIFKKKELTSLALLDAKYNKTQYSNSFKDGEGKTTWSYSNNKYLVNRHRSLLTDKVLLEGLSTLSFNRHSTWLKQMYKNDEIQNNDFTRNFNYFYTDTLTELGSNQKGKKLKDMSSAEHEITKIGLFQNRGTKIGNNNRIINMLYPTMSDKTTMIGLTVLAHNTTLDLSDNTSVKTVDAVFESLVLPEINRILAFQEKIKETGIKGYDKGANLFFFIPELNNIEELFIGNNLSPDILTNSDNLKLLKNTVKEHIDLLIKDKLEEWDSYGITPKDMKFMDNDYMKSITVINKENKLKFAATDYVVNYLISNANIHQLFIGDPAIYYKSKAIDKIQQIEDTFINIGKRLAGDIAPGFELADSEHDHYVQAFISDKESKSLVQEYYNKLLGEEKAKAYSNFEGTDAQEFTSLGEHLYVLDKMGKITDKQKKTIENKILNGQDLDTNELDIVLQPLKPVFVQNIIDITNDVDKRIYIKSSSFPLFEQITRGLEIDKLRQTIEKQGIDRVAFSSAVKVGNFAKPVNIFNKNGSIKTDFNLTDKSLRLPRTGFRIQQEVPYDESKSKINDGTQQRKLLFNNILEVEGVKELESIYLDTYNELFKIGYNNLLTELDVQSDGSLDTGKLQDILKEEAISRGYSINEIRSLQLDNKGRFVIPLAHNSSASKIEALLTSIVDNRVRKKKMRGASFVLGTEEGFQVTKVENENKIKVLNLENYKESDIIFTKEFTGELLPQRTEKVEVKTNVYTKSNINDGIEKLKKDENITISEKDLNHIVDYEAGDKKQAKRILALLNKEYGEVTTTKKVVKPAQIIIPFKFRDEKGNLLNAKDFINTDGTIDTNKLPKELLQMFGFRIPTQSLNSMSYMEVVGFLPYTSGDLLIAPRDFVIQMGSDFDIDKLYSYMYNTTYSNGKLSKYKLDESEIDYLFSKKNDSLVDKLLIEIFGDNWFTDDFEIFKSKFRELELQNTILDVHFDILSNPDERVQSQIAEPLGFGTLKEDANKISTYLKNRNKSKIKFSPLSDKYQKQKFINATAGKSGVAVFSLDSSFNATSQGKNLGLREFNIAIERITPINIKFGKQISSSNLSDPNTINGKRYKSEIISAYLSASVDNEKEQILDKLNINNHTFDVIRVLNQLGFEEDVVTAFINQDIIRDYVNEIIKVSDITSDVYSGKEQHVIDILTKRFAPNHKESDINDKTRSLADIGAKEMLYMIENGDNHKDNLKFQQTQIAILHKFLKLKEFGQQIAGLQSIINSDSAGLNKSMISNKLKVEKLDELGKKAEKNGEIIYNAHKLIGKYIHKSRINQDYIKEGYIKLNDYYVKPTTINGFASIYALNLNSKLWDKHLPYGKKTVIGIFKNIELESTNRDLSINQKTELYSDIWKNMKSYIYTDNNLGLYKDLDVTVERERLIFDTEDNKSLASIIQDLKNETVGKVNPFLNKLSTDINKNGKPSIIKFDAATGENFDELNIYAGFVDLIVNERELGEFNGIKYTTRTLAQDLILSQYVTGGIQEAIQYIKYIPQAYLNTIGFSENLNDFIYNEDNFNSFTRQYFQHNPGKSTKLKGDSVYLKTEIKDVDKIETITLIKDSEELWKLEQTKGDVVLRPPLYISIYNDKSPSKYNLYELTNGLTYKRIDTLGTFGFKEYDNSISYASSLIQGNKAKSKIIGTKIEPKDIHEKESIGNEDSKSLFEQYGLNDIDLDRRNANFLNNVIDKSNNKLFKTYARQLLNNLSKVKINIIENTTLNARGAAQGNNIYINPDKITSSGELEKVLLHELTHVFTNEAIKSGSPQVLRLQGIFNELKNSIDPNKLKVLVEKLESVKQGKPVGLTTEEAEITYGAYNLQEFVALAMTSKEFQKVLNELEYNSEKSFFKELVDRIVDVLEKLGLIKNSALKDVIIDVFAIVESDINTNNSIDYLPNMINQTQEIEIKLGVRHTDGTRKRYFEKNYTTTLALRKKLMTRIPDGYTIKFAKQTGEKGDRRIYDALIVEPIGKNKMYYLPDLMEDGNRFVRLIEEVKFRKRQIEQIILKAKKDNDLKLLEELNSRLAVIDEEVLQLEDASKLEDIQFLAEQDLSKVKSILIKDNITASEIHEARRIVNLWKKGRELFFNEDEKTSLELNKIFGNYQIEAENYSDRLTKLQYKIAKELMKDEFDIETTVSEVFAKQKDIKSLASKVLDISRNNNALLQAGFKINKTATNNTKNEIDNKFEKIDKTISDVSKILPKGQDKYKIFYAKDSKGRTIDKLIDVYNSSYTDTKFSLLNKAKRSNKKEDWNKYLKWTKENEIILDVRKLFPNEELYKSKKFTNDEVTKYKNELIKHLGEKGLEKALEIQKGKIKRYEETREFVKERLDFQLDLTQEEKDNEFLKWELSNSPYYTAQSSIDGVVLKFGKDFIKPKGYEYTYQAARRFDKKGKETNWYNKDFETIQNDEALSNFYNFLSSQIKELNSFLPQEQQNKLRPGQLPDIQKSTLELFEGKNIRQGIRGVYDRFIKSNLTDDINDISYALRDPVTGEVEKSLRIKHLSDKSGIISTLIKRRKIEFFQEKKREPNSTELKEIKDDVIYEVSKDSSFDLGKILKAYTATVINYKHKSIVEDKLRLIHSILNNVEEIEFTANNRPKTTSDGELIKKPKEKSFINLKSQYDYWLNSVFYEDSKDLEGVTDIKKLTKTEKGIKTKLEGKLVTNQKLFDAEEIKEDKYEEVKTELEKQIEELGGNIVGSKVFDNILKWVQLKGMGWNLFSGLNNMGIGFISNLIEASDGRSFNTKQLRKAMWMVKSSIGKNLSFNKINSKEAQFIRNLMDKFDVLKDASNELYESTTVKGYKNKFKFASAYNIQARSEYVNQAPIMLAMMMNTKVKNKEGIEVSLLEVFNTDGSIKDNFDISDETLNNFKISLDQVIKRVHGNYDPDSKIAVKKTSLGKALSQFRTWMFEGVATRLETEKPDLLLGYTVKGRYRSAYDVIKESPASHLLFTAKQLLRKLTFRATKFDEKFSEVDAANMRKNLTELVIYANLIGLGLLLKAATGDDDDKSKFAINYALNQLLRLETDISFYTSPASFESLTKNSVPALGLINDFGQWFDSAYRLILDDDTIEGGINSGDSRFLRESMQMLPFGTQVYRNISASKQVFKK